METKPKTNADRIRAMTDEELAELYQKWTCPPCPREEHYSDCTSCWLSWLRSPVEESPSGE
jgi:hypothetical protein